MKSGCLIGRNNGTIKKWSISTNQNDDVVWLIEEGETTPYLKRLGKTQDVTKEYIDTQIAE